MKTQKKTNYLMHTIDNCPYCQKAKKLFEFYGVEVEYIYKTCRDWPTFPAIYIKDESENKLIGGFTELVSHSQQHGL